MLRGAEPVNVIRCNSPTCNSDGMSWVLLESALQFEALTAGK
jgi:hypothetical protein